MEKIILIESIEYDFNIRRKELSDHLALLKTQTDEKYVVSLSNTGFVILYAHIQGFIENTLISIEKFIINSGIEFNELNNNLKYQCLFINDDAINELIKIVFDCNTKLKKIKIFKTNDYGNILFNNTTKTTNGLDYKMIIYFLEVFGIKNEDFYSTLNIDYLTISFFKNKAIGSKDPNLGTIKFKSSSIENIFDLLKEFRNAIAHGKAEKVKEEILKRKHILEYYKLRNELILEQDIYSEFFNLFVDFIYDKFIMSFKEILIDFIINEKFKK